MNFTFDINKKYETPIITLANPDRSKIGILGNVSGLLIKPRFNAVSEVNFEIYEKYFDDIKSKNISQTCYELIKKNKLLHVTGFGWFVIANVEEINEGNTSIKSVTVYSYEYILNSKNANIPAGTYKFYDPVKPEGTLLQKILEIAPSWRIGFVSSSLLAKYRTFEVPSSNLYSFLMENVEKAYECIFEFDTEKRLINAYTTEDIVKETDISLSFYNLLKNVKIDETKDDIITCLSVHGSGDFDVTTVNPLGNANIYNFDYYKTLEWMPQNLIDKVNTWETKVKNSSLEYSNLLSNLKEQNLKLITSQNELETFKNNLKAQEQVRSAQMPNVQKNVVNKINELSKSISAKENEISKINQEISKIKEKLLKINKDLSFTNNFTKEELLQLDSFIFQGSYTNENFVTTDRMTILEIQEMALQLLEQGTKKLKIYSQPTFNFSMDTVNFLFLEKFKSFIDEIKLGLTIHAEISQDNWVSPILLEMNIDYENPENFTMIFGNQYRLQTSGWTFNELFNQSKVSNSVSNNFSGIMAPIKSGGLNDEVTDYMRNTLNAANQEIINSENQDISIGTYGIKGRRKLENNTFDNRQLMITNNLICMTDDNWQTSKVAIGQTSNGNYGISADILSGKILAGNELTITNESGHFTLNSNGATLKNASFTLEPGNSKIIQNASQGFRVQKKVNNVWKDQLYADSDGNLNIVGKMTISSNSNIGGLVINENSIQSSNGNISLNSDGTAKIGALVIDKNSAKFDGTIKADRLEGTIVNSQIRDGAVTGGKMEYGTVTRREIGNKAIGNTEIIRIGTAGLDSIYATHAYIENLYVSKEGTFAGACRWVYNDNGVNRISTIQQSEGRLRIEADSNLTIKCQGKGGVGINGALAVAGNTVIFGKFMVADGFSKNCIQNIKHYGKRLINAYETAEYYYGDIGTGIIKDGKCKVIIDPIFIECVNLNVDYQVFLTPYGKGDIYVSKRTPEYFIVNGEDIKFCWELKAKRIGFENQRLEEYLEDGKINE